MRLQSGQFDPFDVSKVTGITKTVRQEIAPEANQTVYTMTVLDHTKRTVKRATMWINDVPYAERTKDNPAGMFSRPLPYIFKWEGTAANNGFDIEEGMSVILELKYIPDAKVIDTAMVSKSMTDAIRATKVTIGDYATNPNNYFEQYDLSSFGFKEFIGVNINGILYCHPNVVSFNGATNIMTVNEQIGAGDNVNFIFNTMTE